jgi:hypothetical protein
MITIIIIIMFNTIAISNVVFVLFNKEVVTVITSEVKKDYFPINMIRNIKIPLQHPKFECALSFRKFHKLLFNNRPLLWSS